ncbi:Two-component response regulator-like [Actinidia chinensis var. chinensis]|uniref:Two-component response regulator-like n=1 Tax=Actinidia chinensis var. chinensis TaxID=1590841 RepID=A0A2R6PRT0_ACTCC|nr:Two-component response regulator-like [Actinidia chinensis var. chinensis]
MDRVGILPDKDGGCGGDGGGRGCCSGAFIDRSKVRILLCDNNAKSSEEVFNLLCKCSYQVTSVRSARQVIDALNAEGPDIDIILSEVDLPMAKGLKMLKYIMRDKELQRIPVIMMSAQDEVSIVVKCLRLGAADYLVKPLRTNELLNLWTHMWRRRRMLGLADKNILNYDFDVVASDPSDANTNSTTLFSDDTDDKSRKSANPEMCLSIHQEDEVNVVQRQNMCNAATAAPVEPPPLDSLDYRPGVPGISDHRTGQFASCPKKSELRVGESSAFFTYIKSSKPKGNTQRVPPDDENAIRDLGTEDKLNAWAEQVGNDTQRCENIEAPENCSQGDDFPSSSSIPDSASMERSSTPPISMEFPQQRNSKMEEFSQVHMHPRNESHQDFSGFHAHTAYPYYISGVMNQVMMSSAQMYQKNQQDLQTHACTAMLPQYGNAPHCPPHLPSMASFPYYNPVNICIQPGQMPTTHPWPSYGNSSAVEGKLSKVDRREAALLKFRQKRKDRCFEKKIRYVNRKQLAERRPRVRGQFVRKNGIKVDLNGQPHSRDFDEDEEEEDEEENTARDSFPEDDAS